MVKDFDCYSDIKITGKYCVDWFAEFSKETRSNVLNFMRDSSTSMLIMSRLHFLEKKKFKIDLPTIWSMARFGGFPLIMMHQYLEAHDLKASIVKLTNGTFTTKMVVSLLSDALKGGVWGDGSCLSSAIEAASCAADIFLEYDPVWLMRNFSENFEGVEVLFQYQLFKLTKVKMERALHLYVYSQRRLPFEIAEENELKVVLRLTKAMSDSVIKPFATRLLFDQVLPNMHHWSDQRIKTFLRNDVFPRSFEHYEIKDVVASFNVLLEERRTNQELMLLDRIFQWSHLLELSDDAPSYSTLQLIMLNSKLLIKSDVQSDGSFDLLCTLEYANINLIISKFAKKESQMAALVRALVASGKPSALLNVLASRFAETKEAPVDSMFFDLIPHVSKDALELIANKFARNNLTKSVARALVAAGKTSEFLDLIAVGFLESIDGTTVDPLLYELIPFISVDMALNLFIQLPVLVAALHLRRDPVLDKAISELYLQSCPCGSVSRLRTCSRCHLVPFCSRECQREAWPKHRRVCETWSTAWSTTDFIPEKTK